MAAQQQPRAVGLVRVDVSGLRLPEHADKVRRHAEKMGYAYTSTVRAPAEIIDPVGYALGIAAGSSAAALIVYDLETVDHTPSRVCEMLDLETVSPPATWAAVDSRTAGPPHSHPEHPLTAESARRIMQQHIGCRAFDCPRKVTAYSFLVRAGKIVPPVDSPRERAAARGLSFRPHREGSGSLPDGVSPGILLDVLDGLNDLALDAGAWTATDPSAGSAATGSSSRLS
ncbi:hypothetical protein AB0L57_19860 [Nocardia sp. NPDC052254]|uniref:hypothetical protein n=1 Tax=Nocardia sp. NPDC052254 TaxID=3155681 RepID=UPI003426AF62